MITPALRHALAATALALVLTLDAGGPAHAQLIVKDPTNYAQNVLQAARALQQINNQIQQIQNQALSLINEARNLASLPHSSLKALQDQVARTRQLLGEAQRVAFDVRAIEEAFRNGYRGADAHASDRALVAGAQERWRNSVAAFEDALRVQAGVVGNINGVRAEMSTLVTSSQSATGALQAAQAGNQILALQAQQIADLAALMASQGRAQSLEQARQTAASAQAREQLRRFLAKGSGYQPAPVQMFSK